MNTSLVHVAFSLFLLFDFTTSAYPQWIQTNWPTSHHFFNLYASQGMVFARTWDGQNGGRVFWTGDNGTTWNPISSADSDIDMLSLILCDHNLLAGTWSGLYRSALDDIHWEAFKPVGIPADTAIVSMARNGNSLFAGSEGALYQSTLDDVNAWTEVGTGIPVHARITSIAAMGNALFAASDSNGVFALTQGESRWTAIPSGLADPHISQLSVVGNQLWAVTLKGVFVFDAHDTSWTTERSPLQKTNCLLVVGDWLLAGTDSNGVYLSDDSGLTWTPFSSGLPANTRVWSLAAGSDNVFLFAGTGSGVWRTPLPAKGTRQPTAVTATFIKARH
jgi:hypothetical protein